MRLAPVFAAIAFAALTTTGCAASSEHPTAESQSPGNRLDDNGCRVAKIVAAEPEQRSEEWMFTAVRKVAPEWGNTAQPAEVDRPFAPRIDWDSTRIDEKAAVAAIENSLGYVASGSGPTLVELDQFLSGVKESGTYVGYTAVEKLSIPLTLECQDGNTAKGTLSTWSDAETGVVVCATTYAKGEAPEIALRAQAEFCD